MTVETLEIESKIDKEKFDKDMDSVVNLNIDPNPDTDPESNKDKPADEEKKEEGEKSDPDASQEKEEETTKPEEEEKKPVVKEEKDTGEKKTSKKLSSEERKIQINRDIGQLIKQKQELQTENETLAATKKELEKSGKKEESSSDSKSITPKLEAFKDEYGEPDTVAFEKAMQEFFQKSKETTNNNITFEVKKAMQEEKTESVQKAIKENEQKINQAFEKNVTETAKNRKEGFKDAIDTLKDQDFPVGIPNQIIESEVSADLAHFYATNKDFANEMLQVSPTLAVRMLIQKENEIIANNNKKIKSKAPDPITPVGSGGSGGNGDKESMDSIESMLAEENL